MQYQEHLQLALEATRTGLWTFDPRDRVLQFDRRVGALIGSDTQESLGLSEIMALLSAPDAEAFGGLLADPATCAGRDLELCVRGSDENDERWIAVQARRNAQGGVIGAARDITEQKRNDRHVHLLMREVTHRSKNLLAIIQAMARQTVKDSLSAADFEARFSARLRGLSFSHELLARQDWRGASLTELAEGHLSPLREHHGDRLEIEGPIVFIRPEAAQNIGLALNELGSNAQQFGALSGAQGRVRLAWHIDADETGPQALHMLWTESGALNEIQPPSRQGFGHKVMERVVARALDGTVNMVYAPSGLRWSLRIPLSNIASDPAA